MRDVYSQPQTMRFENLALGFGVNAASAWRAHQLTTTGCMNAGFAADGGLIQCQLSTFTGLGFSRGVGLKSQDGATIQAYDCTASDFQFGFFSSSGAHIGCGDSRAYRCDAGFMTRSASFWAHMTPEREDVGSFECLVGFRAEEGGVLRAENMRSENDRQAGYAGHHSSLFVNRPRIHQTNTALIPSYSASAYYFQGQDVCMIYAESAYWNTARSSSYRISVATYGRSYI